MEKLQPEETPDGGADVWQGQEQEAPSPVASELWKDVNPPSPMSTWLDLDGKEEGTQFGCSSMPMGVEDSLYRKRKEPEPPSPWDQVGNFGVNHGPSGSGGNNPKTAPEGRCDSPLRKKTAPEGEHSFSFPAVPSAKSTTAPKRPSKVIKTINGIMNFFAFIGTNVQNQPPARNDQQIGGSSSRNKGLQSEIDALVTGRSTIRNDGVTAGMSGHDASAMSHIAAAAAGDYKGCSTMLPMQRTAIPHGTGSSGGNLNDDMHATQRAAIPHNRGALGVDRGSSTNPNYDMYARHQQAAIRRNTRYNINGSGHINLTNFASQLNASQFNTDRYSSTSNNNHQEAGVSSSWGSANIASQLNAYPGTAPAWDNNGCSTMLPMQHTAIPHGTETGYPVAFNVDKGGSSGNPNDGMYAMQQAAIPYNTVALNVDKGSSSTNPNCALNARQQAAIPHYTGYNVNGSGQIDHTNLASQLNTAQCNTAGYSSTKNNNHQEAGVSSSWSSANIATELNVYPLGTAAGGDDTGCFTMVPMQHTAIPHGTCGSSGNQNDGMYAMQQDAIPYNTGYNVNESGHMNLTNFASQLSATQYSTAGYSLANNNNHQEAGVNSNWSSANIASQQNAYPLGTALGYSEVHYNQVGVPAATLFLPIWLCHRQKCHKTQQLYVHPCTVIMSKMVPQLSGALPLIQWSWMQLYMNL